MMLTVYFENGHCSMPLLINPRRELLQKEDGCKSKYYHSHFLEKTKLWPYLFLKHFSHNGSSEYIPFLQHKLVLRLTFNKATVCNSYDSLKILTFSWKSLGYMPFTKCIANINWSAWHEETDRETDKYMIYVTCRDFMVCSSLSYKQ